MASLPRTTCTWRFGPVAAMNDARRAVVSSRSVDVKPALTLATQARAARMYSHAATPGEAARRPAALRRGALEASLSAPAPGSPLCAARARASAGRTAAAAGNRRPTFKK